MISAVVIESEEEEVVVAADAIADETVVSVSLVTEVVQPARRAEESSRPEIAAEIRLLSRMRFNLRHYARKAMENKREVSEQLLNGSCMRCAGSLRFLPRFEAPLIPTNAT